MSANITILSGRLTRDPYLEKRTGKDGSEYYQCRFTIAVDRRSKDDKADFPNIVTYGNLAKACGDWLVKGSRVEAAGSLRTGSYQKQVGSETITIYTTEVYANMVEFLDSKEETERRRRANAEKQGGGQAQPYAPAGEQAAPSAPPTRSEPAQNDAGNEQAPQQQVQKEPEQQTMNYDSAPEEEYVPEGFEMVDDDEIPF